MAIDLFNSLQTLEGVPLAPPITSIPRPDEVASGKLVDLLKALRPDGAIHQEFNDNFTAVRDILRDKSCLDLAIGNQDLTTEKGKAMRRSLVRIENMMRGGTLQEVRSHSPKIDVKMAFFSDIDCPDHNGVISSNLIGVFNNKIPFITTKSLFLESAVGVGWGYSGLSQDALTQEGSNWIIYEQTHPEHGAGFIVFVPKTSDMDDEAILQSLDLVTDGTLKKIAPADVFSPPKQKTKFAAFSALFRKEPIHSKLILLDGHGGCGSPIGALSSKNYTDFLSLLGEQKCQGLIISSCYSGGKSGLANLGVKFPVVTHSIGDFPSSTIQPSLDRLPLYFDAFAQFVESGHGMTTLKFRNLLQQIEGNEAREKTPVNLVQIYFPASNDSPAGFRPVGEGGDSFSLTYHTLIKEMIGQSKIQVANKRFLEIHPVVIDLPLIFEEQNPILLSMVPGSARHYLKDIHLKRNSSVYFMDDNGTRAKWDGLGVNKLFLIEKFSSKKQLWSDVAVILDKTGQKSLYLENGQHYYYSSEEPNPIPISDFEYRIRLTKWLDGTKSSEQAIRHSTGAQQTEETFQKAVSNSSFAGKTFLFADLNAKLEGYTERDKELVVDYLLRNGKTEYVQDLIEKGFIDINMNISKEPLIFFVLKGGHNPLFLYLLDKIKDVNMLNHRGATLLLAAAALSNKEAVSKLLQYPEIEVNNKNPKGWTPISLTTDADIFSMLKNKFADVNISLETPLCDACEFYSIEKVRHLLELGFNPNSGKTSPLLLAVCRDDPEMVMLLLDYGANPFLSFGKDDLDRPYPMPIIEAKRRCPPAIVQRMLEHEAFADLSPEIQAQLKK